MRIRFFRRKRTTDQPPKRELRYAEVVDIAKRRKRRLKFLGLLVGSSLLIAGIFFLVSSLRVKKISCELGGAECASNLLDVVDVLRGKSMFSSLEIKHPYLPTVSERIWPDGLKVTFQQPQLLLTLRSEKTENRAYSLTANGYIVGFVDTSQALPIYDYSLDSKLEGERVDSATLNFYQELIAALKKYSNLPIKQINVLGPDEVRFLLDSNATAIAFTRSISAELFSLQAIWESPTIEKSGKVIDLRFENPVLKWNTFIQSPLGVE